MSTLFSWTKILLVCSHFLFDPTSGRQSLLRPDYEVCQLDPDVLTKEYPTQYIELPVDHFHNESRYEPHSNATFMNRYWYDDSYYAPGGPIIVANSGEDNGLYLLNELHVGLPGILAKATNGIAVVLEHRYYGDSFPVVPANISSPLTLEDYRFLTIEQAMADQAFFAQHVQFPSQKSLNLTASNTPFFAIGCSYPGGLTAFERVQYPDLYWGAISSSGITVPKVQFWEWYDAVREYSPPECVAPMQKIINVADNILLGNNQTQIEQLKSVFGMAATTNNTDFAAELLFQYNPYERNWVPCLNQDDLQFCTILGNDTLQFPQLQTNESDVQEIIANGGWANESESLKTSFLNFIGLTLELVPSSVGNSSSNDSANSQLFSSTPSIDNSTSNDTSPVAYSWNYQLCTELGYFMSSGGPQWPLPIISSLVTVDYLLETCDLLFNLTTPPIHTDDMSKYGGYNISYPRLMLVGGEADTWRPVTPLATLDVPTRLNTTSTPDQPWFLIEGGEHCSDWPGVAQNQTTTGFPPEQVQKVHQLQIETIQRWTKEWHDTHTFHQ